MLSQITETPSQKKRKAVEKASAFGLHIVESAYVESLPVSYSS